MRIVRETWQATSLLIISLTAHNLRRRDALGRVASVDHDPSGFHDLAVGIGAVIGHDHHHVGAADGGKELLRAQPRNAQVWSDAGMFYAKSVHNYAKAVACLDRAIRLDSTKVAYYENLGSAQILSGQHRAAVQTLRD